MLFLNETSYTINFDGNKANQHMKADETEQFIYLTRFAADIDNDSKAYFTILLVIVVSPTQKETDGINISEPWAIYYANNRDTSPYKMSPPTKE